MQAKKLLLGAMCTAFLGMVACTGLKPYEIDAPEDLAEKIAEYKAEKEARNQGDTVHVDITHAIVGAEDNSTGWWGDWSQSFEVAAGRLLHLEFYNYSSKANIWSNWNLVLATTLGHSTGDNPAYAEHLVVRSDHYGWGPCWDAALDKNYINGVELADYGDAFWGVFTEIMDGAFVKMEIDRSPVGITFITVEATAENGDVVSKTFNCQLDDSMIYAFITTDGSHFDVREAYTINSKITKVEEVQPASIIVTGIPANVSQGATLEEVLENSSLVAKVTFEDGTSKDVELGDVVFSAAENFATVPGPDVILYTYNKTKSGAVASTPAVGFTKVNVTSELKSITATAKAYVVGSAKYITLSPSALSIIGTYSDGSTLAISASDCTVAFAEDKVVYNAVPGTYTDAFTVTYGSGDDAMTATGDLVIAASSLPAQEENVGAKDFSNGWWSTFTRDWVVAPGESQTIGFTLYSKGAANYQSPCTILRRADLSEYGVVRMDHWCWGAATGDTDPASANFPARIDITSNWNFDGSYFAEHLSGSTVSITVANDGTYASISYYVIYPDGEETHFQRYDKIPVDANDVQFALVTEASYLEFTPATPPSPGDPTVTSIAVTEQPTVTTYYVYDTALPFNPVGVEVTATYSDNSQKVLDNSDLTFSDIPAEAGSKKITVTYEEGITADIDITVVKGTGAFGAVDFSNGWWQTFSDGTTAVAAGNTCEVEMFVYSAATANYQFPCIIMNRAAGGIEYALCRIDNFYVLNGDWDHAHFGADERLESNWNWDTFLSCINLTKVKITVTNNGDNTATARYDLTCANGETHFQLFKNIPVQSDDLVVSFVTEASYAVIL